MACQPGCSVYPCVGGSGSITWPTTITFDEPVKLECLPIEHDFVEMVAEPGTIFCRRCGARLRK